MKSLRKVKPMNQRPHYRTRVIQNRQYLKVDGWRLFLIHWLVTALYADRRTVCDVGAGFCFGSAFALLILVAIS